MGPHAPARSGRHGYLVLEPAAESLASGSGWTASGQHLHDLAHAAQSWAELAEEPHVVPDRGGHAPAQARCAARPRPRCSGQKKLIEQAYTLGAQLGLSVWCEMLWERTPPSSTVQTGSVRNQTGGAAAMPAANTVHVAIELSVSSWLVAARLPGAEKARLHRIEGGDTAALLSVIAGLRSSASKKLGGPAELVCCFEADR